VRKIPIYFIKNNLEIILSQKLHDGMFECACDVGFELMEDGYSCR
jgi:hypothetical protein